MPTTINFLETVIRSLKPSDRRETYWCNGCPGFGLRITPTGSRSFVFKYTIGQKSRWVTIGKYPAWSIRRARHEYDLLYEQVYSYGRDPIQEQNDLRAAEAARLSVEEFTDTYLELGRMKDKVFIDEEERYFRQDIWPVIGPMKLDEVKAEDIEKIQLNIIKRSSTRRNASRDGKVAAKHAIACTRRLFALAKKKGHVERNPVHDIEPLGITGRRDRVLSFREIWAFWNGIEEAGVPTVTSKALKFALVTMQRSNEIRNMRHSAFKPDENVWQMEGHETKNRKMHRVPMNRHALEILEQVKPYTEACPYVFGATRALKPPRTANPDLIPPGPSAFSQAIRRIRGSIGVDDFCPHDLRRTGATWITAVGLPKLYARLMLNHSDGERDVTGEVYVQYSYDFEKRRAAEVWEFVLDQIVTSRAIEDVPTLESLRKKVNQAGLI